MSSENFFKQLAKNLKERNNPTDLKPSIIGKVVQLNPIVVQIESERVLLTQGEELILSEWFIFRCNIDKTFKLSQNVPDNRESCADERGLEALQLIITENQRLTAESVNAQAVVRPALTPCISVANPITIAFSSAINANKEAIVNLSNAINYLSDAIQDICDELLALKCILNVGDYVTIASLDETDKYVLIDKI